MPKFELLAHVGVTVTRAAAAPCLQRTMVAEEQRLPAPCPVAVAPASPARCQPGDPAQSTAGMARNRRLPCLTKAPVTAIAMLRSMGLWEHEGVWRRDPQRFPVPGWTSCFWDQPQLRPTSVRHLGRGGPQHGCCAEELPVAGPPCRRGCEKPRSQGETAPGRCTRVCDSQSCRSSPAALSQPREEKQTSVCQKRSR